MSPTFPPVHRIFFLFFLTKSLFLQGQFLLEPTGRAVTDPFRWREGEWATALGIGLTATAVLGFDAELRNHWVNSRSEVTDAMSTYVFEPWGDWYALGLVAGTYGYGWLNKDKDARRLGKQMAEAYVIAAGAAQVFKHLLHRARPDEDNNPYNFAGPWPLQTDQLAMPSLHAAVAFAMARVVHHSTDKRWLSVAVHLTAAGVAWSRLNDNRHWSSDVLLGSALGWWIGNVVARENRHVEFRASSLPGGQLQFGLSWSLDSAR